MSLKVSCACFALLTDRRCGSTTTKYLPEIEFVCLFSLFPATSAAHVAARARRVSQSRAAVYVDRPSLLQFPRRIKKKYGNPGTMRSAMYTHNGGKSCLATTLLRRLVNEGYPKRKKIPLRRLAHTTATFRALVRECQEVLYEYRFSCVAEVNECVC